MSLLKQLLVSLSVALLGILVGTLVFSTTAARSYLAEQLYTQSDNAVASLALSLSQAGNQEPVTQELLMSALFDTGQFRAIQMTAPDGRVVFERQQNSAPSEGGVPQWFQLLMPLPLAQGQRAISDGWRQIGQVQVTVDNRSAQTALWDSALKMAGLIVLAGGAWALFVTLWMRWFKKVLRDEVTAQVMRIGTSEPMQHVDEPSSLSELDAISSAIQTTHVRVQQAKKVQAERIESLELETNSDLVTGLPNRKYFLNELNKALQSDAHAHGQVLLMRQRDLQAINAALPRQEVDAWLKNWGQQVQATLQENQAHCAHLARLNGSDFALILPGEQSVTSMHLVQAVRKVVQSLSIALGDGQRSRWAFVLTAYTAEDSAKDVLGRLDQGLMQAESAGHGDVEYAEHARTAQLPALAGVGHWQEVLTQALAHSNQLRLEVQATTSASLVDTEVRHEASLQLQGHEGQAIGASLFLPAAVRLGLSADFDLRAMALAMQWLAEHPGSIISVRLSLPSIEHPHFMENLQAFFAQQGVANAAHLPSLQLELDAHALEVQPQSVMQLASYVSQYGVGLGLRRLDQAPKALLEFAHVPLRYVKVGGFFAQNAMDNVGAKSLLEAMLDTAQAQRMRVYVTDVVSPRTADWLRIKGASLLMPKADE